ncbi:MULTISPECIES: DUF6966 domain-containing protein [unclassified Pseudomonas]|uniref:DUF6966 domain-containing protein n=1 Tax=Pseudomonas sp. R1-18 TaxID=1632772 RepID=UPI003DA7D346
MEPLDAKGTSPPYRLRLFRITCLLSAYGGMGSFNDLVLGQTANEGPTAWALGHVGINDDLQELRDRAAQLAFEIQRSQ